MAQGHEPASPAQMPPRTRSRLGLFLPYLLLLLLAVLWSAGWFWARGKAAEEMDAWTAREAAAGRDWTCTDRTIEGYPFRIELRCAALRLARSDGGFTLGPVTAVVQVYDPRHVILEAAGPFHTEQGDLVGDVSWKSLEASFHGSSDGFSRADLVVDEPKGRVTGADASPIDFTLKALELHARPTPGRFASDGAVDVSLQANRAAIPRLDALSGNADPADIALAVTLERAAGIRTGTLPRELETWRAAEGRLEVTGLSIVKGDRRLQAKGEVGIDEAHRPAGQFDIRAAGLESLIAQIMGERLGRDRGALLGNIVGQFLGGLQGGDKAAGGETAQAKNADAKSGAALKPLPQLRLAGGRLMLGPLPIPNVVLPVLY